MTGKAPVRSRISWSLFDQGLSSATNFILIVVVANAVDQEGFGAFGLALAAFQITLALSRAMVGEPLAVRHSADSPAQLRDRGAEATGAALMLGAAAAVVVLALAPFGGAGSRALVVLAFVLPGLLVQDAYRYVSFAAGRPERACILDGVWTVLQAATVGLAVLLTADAAGYVAAWGVAGLGAALLGIRVMSVVPRPRQTRKWLVDHRDLGPRFAAESIAVVGVTQLVFVAVNATSGLAAAGAYRGGLAVFGPLRVILQGLASVVVPEGVRIKDQPGRLRLLVGASGLANAGVALAVGGLLRFGPDAIGSAMLGDTWEAARRLLGPLTLATVGSGLSAGAMYGLRALAAARESFRTQVVIGAVTLAVCWLGAARTGASGAAWALAFSQCAGAILLWIVFTRTQSRPAADA